MRTFRQTCGIGIVTLVLLTGVTTGAFGQGVGGGIGTDSAPSSAGPKGVLKLRATIICANCTLDEAKAAHPALSDLYELSHDTGKVVLRVSTAKETVDTPEKGEASPRWSSIGEPRQLSVRGEDRLFQTLVDPSNLAKEVELTGIIRTTRTLDLSGVTVLG
jgi:hypothetical protein